MEAPCACGYETTFSRTGPPSSLYTGFPTDFPLMSHSAMSIALMAHAYIRSAGKKFPLNISCHSFSVSHGSSPTTASARWLTASLIALPTLAVPTSPSPCIPASVSTRTMKYGLPSLSCTGKFRICVTFMYSSRF